MIIVINKHLLDANITENKIWTVTCIYVRGPTMARFAMVLVLLSLGIHLPYTLLLFEGRTSCSTSYSCPTSYYPQVGRPLLYELLSPNQV